MAAITISDFIKLENFDKKYCIKVFVSGRNDDGTFNIKDATALASLAIEEGAEDSNKMLGVGVYVRLVNPKKISEDKLSMPKKSSSSITRPFSLGENVSEKEETEPQESSVVEKKSLVDTLMEVLLAARPDQVFNIFAHFCFI